MNGYDPVKTRRYYLLNRDRILAKKAEDHRKNSDRDNLRSRAWYEANKDKAKAQQAEYRKKNRKKERERAKAYREKNKEIVSAKGKEKYRKNKAAINAYVRWWRANNKQRIIDTRRKYYPVAIEKARERRKTSPHEAREAVARRRARLLAQHHPLCADYIVEMMFEYANEMEKRTGVRQSVDHIIPLCHGGWHHQDNLQILPAKMNSEKSGNPFWIAPYGYRDWRSVPRYLWPENLRNEYEILITATHLNDN